MTQAQRVAAGEGPHHPLTSVSPSSPMPAVALGPLQESIVPVPEHSLTPIPSWSGRQVTQGLGEEMTRRPVSHLQKGPE